MLQVRAERGHDGLDAAGLGDAAPVRVGPREVPERVGAVALHLRVRRVGRERVDLGSLFMPLRPDGEGGCLLSNILPTYY